MVFTEEHEKLKEEGEKWMKETANSCTITAALIATVMFAAVITVPGGTNSGTQSRNGFPIFIGDRAFIVFAILTTRYAEEDFLYALPKRLIIGLVTLFLSLSFMMVAFSVTLYLVFGQRKGWVLILVVALAGLPIVSFVLLQFPLLIKLICSIAGFTFSTSIIVTVAESPKFSSMSNPSCSSSTACGLPAFPLDDLVGQSA
ncbi:hypothetical protein BUALT_Bualt16G0043700 [Buddleja alternifolia]|uniref:PGG domain-containing protein n=1 Tax=Buddleja alternifolia TaxID=168488 RepID=A0AAV6WEF8_9LAMI|nr:hypothetical protein BUALT_Bualt16G0043700 [Buddleja alternifolia]